LESYFLIFPNSHLIGFGLYRACRNPILWRQYSFLILTGMYLWGTRFIIWVLTLGFWKKKVILGFKGITFLLSRAFLGGDNLFPINLIS